MATGAGQRTKSTCPKGHPYDAANTYSRPGTTWRECRACKALWRERNRGGSAVTIRRYAPGATS